MERWIILYEFSILIYCISNYVQSGMENSTFAIFMILSYICLKTCYYIFSKAKLKSIILIVTLILILFQYAYVYKLIILLLPINIYMLIGKSNQHKWTNALAIIISVHFIKHDILQEYILVATLGYLVYMLVNSSFNKIQRLTEENESLNNKNTILFDRLNKDVQFQKQFKYMSKLEERNKIAQEIHDKIGHTLSGGIMQLEAAKLLLDIDIPKSKTMIQSTINVLREGLDNIRITLKNIKPPSEQLGINKLKLLIEEFSFNSGIMSNFLYNGNIKKITTRQWRLIYDNINEALTNTIKYSKASKVNVNIEIHNKIIKLEVKDDGIGCSNVIKGLGIIGMEERIGNEGGQVIVDGAQGFSVISIIPLDQVKKVGDS
ncbi:MAG: sensor histidine kinase [Clostridium sp.]|uniref:sensor histidine kinase n=1 Tax=Clostridium sp. TaxID=1506 RepID=UPI003D6C935B